MIRIHRCDAPSVLLERGSAATQDICTKWSSGDRASNAKLYGHDQVKEMLFAMQFRKCCYCDMKISGVGVDHYRPRSVYYWLTYEWTNLLGACGPCNSRKLDRFGLRDEASRVTHHEGDISQEIPLFLNPAEEDPETILGWDREQAVPIPGPDADRAVYTINKLRLNRIQLLSVRLEVLELANRLIDALNHKFDPRVADALADLCRGSFSAMLKEHVRRIVVPKQ